MEFGFSFAINKIKNMLKEDKFQYFDSLSALTSL